ncbi:hypothetical protein GF382_02920 [Candidatus Falkowbacteria bacterium]|nr:hypothetical protein [Candidatus Falkowbacteria bacterium]
MKDLNAKAFGLACGIIWGIVFAGMTLLAATTGYAFEITGLIGSIYPAFNISIGIGTLLALAYGFIDAFIGGYLLAWLYNKLNK